MAIRHLIVTCWGGERRNCLDENYNRDRGYYIRKQIEFLSSVPHNLDRITFANNIDPHESVEFRKAIRSIPPRIQSATVDVYEQENKGMSYGLFDSVCKQDFPNLSEYYFFTEDDFLFVHPNFDTHLIDLINTEYGIGAVCDYVSGYPPHPAISCGLYHKELIRRLLSAFGSLPCDNNKSVSRDYGVHEQQGQVGWGIRMSQLGISFIDVRSKFTIAFQEFTGTILWPLGYPIEATKPLIQLPTQLLHSHSHLLQIAH